MKSLSFGFVLMLATSFAVPHRAGAAVLDFEGWPTGTEVLEEYANIGVRVYSPYGLATIRLGVSNGDPEGWATDGSAGPNFLGLDDGTTSIGVQFDLPVSQLSFDVFRPAAAGDTTLYFNVISAGIVVTNASLILRAGVPWTNITVNSPQMDTLYVSAGMGRLALDNVQFTHEPGAGAPYFRMNPQSVTVYKGRATAIHASYAGQLPLTFQWYLNGTLLAGATNPAAIITNAQPADAGAYIVAVTNQFGGQISQPGTLTVLRRSPVFTYHPNDQSLYATYTAYLSAGANGYPSPSFQWQFQGTNLPGATNRTLNLYNVQPVQAGSYRVVATNLSGSATSSVALLTVLTELPFIISTSYDAVYSAGSHAELTVTSSGLPLPSFRWSRNGVLIPGEIKGTLKLYNITTNDAGLYSVVASNIAGQATNAGINLAVVPPNTLDSWEGRGPNPAGNQFSGVCFGSGGFVAVGRFGVIATSVDGSNWTRRVSGTLNHLYSIVFGNGLYTAVGSAGELITSPDGAAWTKRTAATSNGLYAVTFASGQFVAVGRFGTIRTSPNGVSWTARHSGTSNHLRGITYGGGLYVVVGSRNEIRTSPDTITWTQQITPTTYYNDGRNLRAITHGNGTFVAVGNNGAVYRSTNGTAWTEHTEGYGLRGVLFHNGSFIAVDRYGYVFISTDGLAWTMAYSPSYRSLYDIAAGNGRLVTVGNYGTLTVSDNGTAWQAHNEGEPRFQTSDAAYGNGHFVAGSSYQSGILRTSADGDEWNTVALDTNQYYQAVVYGQGKFVTAGYNSEGFGESNRHVWVSTNATTWTPRPIGHMEPRDLAYDQGRFIAVGSGFGYLSNGVWQNSPTVALSVDGDNWTTSRPASLPNGLVHVTARDGIIVVAGGSSFYASTDGANWTNSFNGHSGIIIGLTAGNGSFAAIAYSPWASRYVTLLSSNGLAWTEHKLETVDYLSGISFLNGRFIVFGSHGLLLSSSNGMDWVRRNSQTRHDVEAAAYGHSSHVLFVGNGSILRSANDAAEFRPPAHAFTNGSFQLIFEGELNRVYRLQYSSNLSQWFDLGSVTNTQRKMTLTDPNAAARSHRFYRLISP